MSSSTSYPILLLVMVAASFVGAMFAVLGTRWSAAFDAPFWTAFSATILAYAGTMVVSLVLYLLDLITFTGGLGGIAAIPVLLLLVTAALYAYMIRYPKGGGPVGLSLGIRVAIVQLGLTAMVGVALMVGIHLLS
jgi:hypothetical protein